MRALREMPRGAQFGSVVAIAPAGGEPVAQPAFGQHVGAVFGFRIEPVTADRVEGVGAKGNLGAGISAGLVQICTCAAAGFDRLR